jgi:hypothetical protein
VAGAFRRPAQHRPLLGGLMDPKGYFIHCTITAAQYPCASSRERVDAGGISWALQRICWLLGLASHSPSPMRTPHRLR